MKVVIIEDEALAAERLEKIIKEVDPDINVEAKLGSIKESIKWLSNHTVDLIFLDIQLSDGISFSIFDQINIKTPVIFTTAYDQYAIKAFQLNTSSTFEKWSFMGNMNNSLTLPHNISMELSGFYTSQQLHGNFKLLPKYSVDMAVQKKIFKDKGTVKLAANYVFDLLRNKAKSKYDNIDLSSVNKFDSQRVTLTFTYRFGSEKNNQNRSNRSTSSSDEQGRSGR